MPWSAAEFKAKHGKHLTNDEAVKAAKIANAILRETGDEGKAIRIGLSKSKRKKK